MNTYNAIIIDDEANAIELLKLNLQELFPEISIRRTCTNWVDALQALKQESYDLIFMDILMPGKTGIELARLLPDITGKLIFVTAHEEYALEAFKCYAFGYLLKPIDDNELHEVVSRALALMHQPQTIPGQSVRANKDLLGIPDSRGIDYIYKKDIIYLQAENKCTKVVLADRVIYSSYHLGRFREYLEEDYFFQVHRSYIINLAAVKRYISKHMGVVMNDNTEIPVARSVREELLKQFTTLHKLPG